MPEKDLPHNHSKHESSKDDDFEVVIGLEVHAELATKTKLFSDSANHFGDEPNTNIDPVCLGLPGSLPVLNKRAVELSIRVGIALGSTISPCTFARKNYFYPDMPKNFQTSQYDQPLNVGGSLTLASGKKIGITRAHLEEDTGKITHIGGGGRIHDAKYCLIDYNRAGVPLLEIVSEPEISSGEEAREYVKELRAILVAVEASDGKMEEGSLRVDTNISVRKKGEVELGVRTEIKNVNSLRSLLRAVEFETKRHISAIQAGEELRQETRHFNEDTGETHPLRSKEDDMDYRYFPEPDLVPLDPDEKWVEEIREQMPALPTEKRVRLKEASGADDSVIALLVSRGVDDLVDATIQAGADAAQTIKLAEQNLSDGAGKLEADAFLKVVNMLQAGELSATQVKAVLTEVIENGVDPKQVAESMGFEAMDEGELEGLVEQVISQNPDEWERYKGGDQKLVGFFVGQMMKLTQGKADGKVVTAMLSKKAAN